METKREEAEKLVYSLIENWFNKEVDYLRFKNSEKFDEVKLLISEMSLEELEQCMFELI